MKPLRLGVLLAALAVAPALAQKPDPEKKPAATKPAETKPAAKPVAKLQVKPKSEARQVAPPPVPVRPPVGPYRIEYRGDVPNDPGMRSWQPPPRGQR